MRQGADWKSIVYQAENENGKEMGAGASAESEVQVLVLRLSREDGEEGREEMLVET